MQKLNVLPELTKKYILERVTQEEIMEYYIGIPINNITIQGNSFTSPFRTDSNPTCNYYYFTDKKGETRLKVRDWDGTFNGDIFDVASYFEKIKIITSQGFKLLLHKIAYNFTIHKYTSNIEREKLSIVIEKHIALTNLKIFKVVPRTWNEYDKRYWFDRYGVSSLILRELKVIPIQELHITDDTGYFYRRYTYTAKDPAYAYYGGKIEGITIWKIYFPLREKKKGQIRFLTNYKFTQGLHCFKPAKIGIITKALKDVAVWRSIGIQAVAPHAETYLMTKDEFFDIKNKCDIILTNFDYDKAGIILANKYKKVHGCLPLMFTKGKYNQPNFGVKDVSDFREAYGREKLLLLTNNLLDKYKEQLESLNKYNYESLKWLTM